MAERKSFLELLKLDYEKNPVIALVGGGGKTSLIYCLAEELRERKKKVIITTTTRMAYDDRYPIAPDGDEAKIREALQTCGCVMAADYDKEKGKFKALNQKRLDSLVSYNAVVLAEADGAKRMPVKVPKEWEPVIAENVNIVIGVIGLDCLYHTIASISHRPETVSTFLGKEPSEILEPGDLIEIASSGRALRKDTEGREYRVYFNKADILEKRSDAEFLIGELKKRKIEAVYGSLKEAGRI